MSQGPDFSKLARILTPDNLAVVETLYAQYLDDPESVDDSWRPIFDELGRAADEDTGVTDAPSFEPRSIFNPAGAEAAGNGRYGATSHAVADLGVTQDLDAGLVGRLATLVAFYRLHGHLQADLDPLERERADEVPALPVDPFTDDELSLEVPCGSVFPRGEATVGDILERLKRTYTGTIGVEFVHIPQAERRAWLQQRMEWTENTPQLSAEERVDILRKLGDGDALERFLHKKYVGMKRFSIQGGESLLPALDWLIEAAAEEGVREIVIGMAHRGRLAVLSSILKKSAQEIFSEFERNPDPRATMGVGDVKYHMGFSHDHTTRSGDNVHLSLAFNPSHLEAVNPVVLGRVRAKQDRIADTERNRGLAVLLHGDAAFAGQGLVAETLQLSQIPGYTTGGSIHIVINNQIGFTTNPWESRSTTYATDVAHMLEIPVFHVNGDDPEALVHVVRLAMAYRTRFHTDVVIDLVCYRRHGHNEGDEPRFTQPSMYSLIDEQASVRELYAKRLVDDEVVSAEDAEALIKRCMDEFAQSLDEVRAEPRRSEISQLEGLWAGFRGGEFDVDDGLETTIDRETIERIGKTLTTTPEHFDIHRIVERLLSRRAEMIRGERPVDWGMGEALAFGSLLLDGYPVRVSGQDSIRGTFGHRHAAVLDGDTGERYFPLSNLDSEQPMFSCHNSMLSEAAVLGFDYGYSLDTPDGLIVWEAQFGDFANNAQVIIDQFITSGEVKWRRLSGLVMLLPHGYEGQGPEHSSARLERYLQLCAMDNIQVCNLTTPAQYFHVLRRQVLNSLRKPLVIMSPKSLLRHKAAVSTLSAFSEGAFHPVIPESRDWVRKDATRRVLLCSGKIYYDLAAEQERLERDDIAIVRVEQLYPLMESRLVEAVEQFPNREELVWVQEEPENMGAWLYMLPRLIEIFGRDPLPRVAARMPSASPATGSSESHAIEQQMILDEAFAD